MFTATYDKKYTAKLDRDRFQTDRKWIQVERRERDVAKWCSDDSCCLRQSQKSAETNAWSCTYAP